MTSILEASIIDAIDNHCNILFKKKNVIGVGLGFKNINNINTFEPCLHVLVKKKLPLNNLYKNDIVPKNFLGIKTDVIRSGNITYEVKESPSLYSSYNPYNRYNLYNPYTPYNPSFINYNLKYSNLNSNLFISSRPLAGGCSIGNYDSPDSGTLGAIVFGNNDRYPYILSNNHVLANNNKLRYGSPIIHPGRADGLGRPVAKLSRFIYLEFDSPYFKKHTNNTIDCAIAKLNENILYDTNIPSIGIIQDTTYGKIGMQVLKVGRTTGFTSGIITTIHATMQIQMSNYGYCVFNDVLLTTPMSRPGDSGSLIVDAYSKKAVGLLFAGSNNDTIMCPIDKVLRKLNVHFEP